MNLIQKHFADLLNVSSQRLTALRKDGHIVRGTDKIFDLNDPINRAFLREHFHREHLRYTGDGERTQNEELERRKLEADITWKTSQTRKLQREHEVAIGDLLPITIYERTMGLYDHAIRNNLLSLGGAIARGNTKLRDRIEKQITKRLEAIIKQVHSQRREFIDAEIARRLREIQADD